MAERRADSPLPMVVEGLRSVPLDDLYHSLLKLRWSQLLGLVFVAYIATNSLFAGLYLIGEDNLHNARPGSFSDAFFFSVQTLATIGYGGMMPQTLWANVLVSIEALVGLLGVAMVTGLIFAKFARPTARVVFSDALLVSQRDGCPHLILRIANARASQIVEASVRLTISRDQHTQEGERIRRVHDLTLVRSTNPIFALSWLVMHKIDAESPLYGLTPEDLTASQATFFLTLTGIDDTYAQTVHARYFYRYNEVKWGWRFEDMITALPDGTRRLRLADLHKRSPQAAWTGPRTE